MFGAQLLLWKNPTPVAAAEMLDQVVWVGLEKLLDIFLPSGAIKSASQGGDFLRSDMIPQGKEIAERIVAFCRSEGGLFELDDFARQQVGERLTQARDTLPDGVQPQIGPVTTGLGEIVIAGVRDGAQIKAILKSS